MMQNKVFIATSLDGYIADANGSIDWLTEWPNPTDGDAGYSQFIDSVDAILMGRNTFEKVLSFGIDWPYSKPVFVWSSRLKQVPPELMEKVEIVTGSTTQILKITQGKGFKNLYIDGGKAIQAFLQEGLIHQLTLTQVPIILGSGISLFENAPKMKLKHIKTETFDNGMVQVRYEV